MTEKFDKEYWYLATMYTLYPGTKEDAYKFACKQTAMLINEGIVVQSPIAHSYGLAEHGGLPHYSHDFWMRVDAPMLENAKGVIIVTTPGWEKSTGIAYEKKWAEENNKPVLYMIPYTIPNEFKAA